MTLHVIEGGGSLKVLPPALAVLRDQARWVVWDATERDAQGKLRKIPLQCHSVGHPEGPRPASTRRPEQWSTFEVMQRALAANPNMRSGYVVTEDERHAFLDFDGCRNPETGEVSPWARRIVESLRCYTEITPSGTGLRVIGLMQPGAAPINCSIPGALLGATDSDPGRSAVKAAALEVFFHRPRYVTVSGWLYPGTEGQGLADIHEHVEKLAALAPPAAEHEPNPDKELDEADLLACVAAIPNPVPGIKGGDNWNGYKTVAMAIWNASAGSDVGLAAFLAWSAKDPRHNDQAALDVWDQITNSPPDQIGGGTLVHHAREEAARHNATFVQPGRRPDFAAKPFDPAQAARLGISGSRAAAAATYIHLPPGAHIPVLQPGALPQMGKLFKPLPPQSSGAGYGAAPGGASGYGPSPGMGQQGHQGQQGQQGQPGAGAQPQPGQPGFGGPWTPPVEPKQPLFEMFTAEQMLAKFGNKPRHVIEDVLMEGSAVLLTGVPGAGKSPIAQDMIVAVVLGIDWAGHKVAQSLGVYVAGESQQQTALNHPNLAAGKIELATAAEPGSVSLLTAVGELRRNLLSIAQSLTLESDTQRLIESIMAQFDEGKLWHGREVSEIRIIVLDTLRALSAGAVTSDEDMAKVQQCIATLREAFPAAAILILHHASKASPTLSSGSNRLDALADTILNMQLLPKDADVEFEGNPLQRQVTWGPGPSGWKYSRSRLVMGRNRIYEMMSPKLMLMAARKHEVRLSFDGENPLIEDEGKAALAAAAATVKEAPKPGQRAPGEKAPRKAAVAPGKDKPVPHPGDDGAFASGAGGGPEGGAAVAGDDETGEGGDVGDLTDEDEVVESPTHGGPVDEVYAPAQAKNVGAELIRAVILRRPGAEKWHTMSTVLDYLKHYPLPADPEYAVAAGMQPGAPVKQGHQMLARRYRELERMGRAEKKGGGAALAAGVADTKRVNLWRVLPEPPKG